MRRLHISWRDLVFGIVAAVVVGLDQATKVWIRSSLDVGEAIFDAGIFQIIHVNNTGAAFGIFKGYAGTLAIASVVGVAFILVLIFMLKGRWSFLDNMTVRIAIGLMLGGTIGNLIDRAWRGSVTDFFDVKIWPVFNIADASAVIGSIVLAICIIFMARETAKKT